MPAKREPKEEDAPTGLFRQRRFKAQGCSPRELIEWVIENLIIEDVGPYDAPSAGAYGLLLFARENPESRSLVYQQYFKLLPSRQQIEKQQSYEDDGKDQTAFIDRLIAKVMDEPPVATV